MNFEQFYEQFCLDNPGHPAIPQWKVFMGYVWNEALKSVRFAAAQRGPDVYGQVDSLIYDLKSDASSIDNVTVQRLQFNVPIPSDGMDKEEKDGISRPESRA